MARVPLWLVGAAATTATAALAGGLVIFAKVGDAPPAALAPASAECEQNRKAIADLDKQIADLKKGELPADIARQAIEVIDELIAGLKTVDKSTDQVIGPTLKAQKKLDDIAKKITAAGGKVPDGWPKLKAAIGGLGGDIKSGVKKFKGTDAGKGVSDVDALRAVIKPTIENLETLRTVMDGVLAADNAANGTGAEQIAAMKFGFDQLRKALPVNAVPGLGKLFDAYSDALGGMSRSVGQIEDATKAKLRMADEALKGTDVSAAGLYPGMQTPREQAQARLAALIEARARLATAREELECDKPPPPKDPCKEGDMKAIQDLVDQMTGREREEFEYRQREYERIFLATAGHSLGQPRPEASAEERKVLGQSERLKVLKQAMATRRYFVYAKPGGGITGVRSAIAEADKLADEVGVRVKPRGGQVDERDLAAMIAVIEPEIARQTARVLSEGDARYRKALEVWNREHAELLAAAKDAGRQRDRARAALARRTAEVIDQESKAKHWDKAKYDLFDECFPTQGEERRRRAAPPPPASSPAPPAAPSPAPAPAPAAPFEPKPKGKCVRGGGIAGAVDDVACQIGKGG